MTKPIESAKQEFEEIEIKGTSCLDCRFHGVNGIFQDPCCNLYGLLINKKYEGKWDRPEYCKDQTIKLRIK